MKPLEKAFYYFQTINTGATIGIISHLSSHGNLESTTTKTAGFTGLALTRKAMRQKHPIASLGLDSATITAACIQFSDRLQHIIIDSATIANKTITELNLETEYGVPQLQRLLEQASHIDQTTAAALIGSLAMVTSITSTLIRTRQKNRSS